MPDICLPPGATTPEKRLLASAAVSVTVSPFMSTFTAMRLTFCRGTSRVEKYSPLASFTKRKMTSSWPPGTFSGPFHKPSRAGALLAVAAAGAAAGAGLGAGVAGGVEAGGGVVCACAGSINDKPTASMGRNMLLAERKRRRVGKFIVKENATKESCGWAGLRRVTCKVAK